ncbi:leukocyte receptor cluster member 1 homolog [Scaptodrosophila lebanonensis]|uniref:Leukocyte receptor cluster member 1 homolog n=1 Tax=Drosophila lebanonensis TaxID=7225 RepID=A0A6J2SXK5_DROLE|nr:leukocyte receptor cluster member 1 homolog [Scaptodrosophila lebanonensis]
MNILPKKRWHVRTKDNIARVRRDEAAAREDEQKRQDKLELAESEARINFLRRQSGAPTSSTRPSTSTSTENAPSSSSADTNVAGVDLFINYKAHIKTTNKDFEKERKEEQEKYEKQVGYLTYLGQNTNEALKQRSWYEVAPKRTDVDDKNDIETHLERKLSQDPLTLMNALLPSKKKPARSVPKRKRDASPTPKPVQESPAKIKKHKKEKKHHKKHKKHHESHKRKKESRKEADLAAERRKREKLEILRKQRLRREKAEREREQALVAPKDVLASSTEDRSAPTPRIMQKYNSQFNPEFAKQNMI